LCQNGRVSPCGVRERQSRFKALLVDEQSSLLNALGKLHFRAKEDRLKALKSEMTKLGMEDTRAFFKPMVRKTRAKPKPKYQSRKDCQAEVIARGFSRWPTKCFNVQNVD
jgi:hypothetical protein